MKPPSFRYARPSTLGSAVALLQEDDARPLAGGQSLIPMMNFRLARPSVLVDLSRLPDLGRIEIDGDELVLGAMVRQRTAETSPLVASACPLLVEALHHVGHLPIRTRGTVVGSLVHADPRAEIPVVAVALDARVVAVSERGTRVVAAGDLYLGPFRTALAPDELVVEVRFPIGAGPAAYMEVSRRHGDFALLGVAGAIRPYRIHLAMTGGDRPVRLHAAGLTPQSVDDSVAALDGALADRGDDPEARYRRRLAPVLVRRTLEALRA